MKVRPVLFVFLLAAMVMAACAPASTPAPLPTAVPPATEPPTQAPQVLQTANPEPAWSRVSSTGTIIFGSSLDYPPYESYDADFQPTGFDVALARELGTRLGYRVEFLDIPFEGLLPAVQAGQVDAFHRPEVNEPALVHIFDRLRLRHDPLRPLQDAPRLLSPPAGARSASSSRDPSRARGSDRCTTSRRRCRCCPSAAGPARTGTSAAGSTRAGSSRNGRRSRRPYPSESPDSRIQPKRFRKSQRKFSNASVKLRIFFSPRRGR